MGETRHAAATVMTHRLALLVATLALAPAAAQQQPTFRTRSETVRVDALVTERGRPVRNLQASDFELLDSGVRQQIEFVTFEELSLTVGLALDTSTSISAEELAHLRSGGQAVLDQLQPQDRVSLLTFANTVTLRERLTPTATRIRTALDALRPSPHGYGSTALIDACFTAMTLLDEEPGRSLLIVFTDGVDTASWLPANRVLEVARRSNLVAYGVSTAPLPKGSFLRDFTDVTGGDAIEIKSADAVGAAFVRILDEFRQRYLVAFSPENVPAAGWHPLTLRVKGRKVDVRARPGYLR